MSHLLQRPCSEDGSFEKVDIVPATLPPPNVDLNAYVPVSQRTQPLDRPQFHAMLDPDGRLVNEHMLRQAVFLGGVQPCIRKEVWKFLFGLYPCSSTTREREALLLDYIVKYNELKARWKTLLVLCSGPGESAVEQGLVARYQLPVETPHGAPDATNQEPIMERAMDDLNSRAATVQAGSIDWASLGHPDLSPQYSAPDDQQRVDCLQLQARVYVNRKRIDVNQLRAHIRVIDKDVPRTDRDVDYFKGHANPHLTQLRDILATFACYNHALGYAQGMNDILARFLYIMGSEMHPCMNDILANFLYIMGSEVETFWVFQRYMDTVQNDFMEVGMTHKIDLVRHLLTETDSHLLRQLQAQDLGNLFFCHRWLLLGFKREFSFQDSLRCFEILSSHHLELHTLTAERALMKEEMNEFANSGGDSRFTNLAQVKDYTFEVFMCAAILMESREELAKCTDPGMVFSFINNLKFDLDDVLSKAEKLFFTYCKKTVSESFQLVDTTAASKRGWSSFSALFS